MSIDLADRIRRAVELARLGGVAVASDAVVTALGRSANGLAAVDASTADVLVAFASELDARGHAVLDAVPRAPRPVVLVLDDDAALVGSCEGGTRVDVVAAVFRRGVLRLVEGRFVLTEVEEDVSAREVREESGVPMYADGSLTAFR